jgi:hypothetical protein
VFGIIRGIQLLTSVLGTYIVRNRMDPKHAGLIGRL